MLRIPSPLFIPIFSVRMAFFLALLLTTFKYLAPGMWAQNRAAGLWLTLGMFILLVTCNGVAEGFFHRYILHAIPFRWTQSFAQKHRAHHNETSVRLAREHGRSIVKSDYAIEEAKQYEHAQFPWWAYFALLAPFVVVAIPLQLILPRVPLLGGVIVAVAFTIWHYEVKHFAEHLPYRIWQRTFTLPLIGRRMERAYAFHLMHHANVKVNEGIAGAFGWYIFDWLFRTYHIPSKLLVNGVEATAEDFKIPEPIAFVKWLDGIVADRERRLTNVPS
ncbi:MAG: hypothetical protein AAB490_00905 [Patescibacteria group bacterium]